MVEMLTFVEQLFVNQKLTKNINIAALKFILTNYLWHNNNGVDGIECEHFSATFTPMFQTKLKITLIIIINLSLCSVAENLFSCARHSVLKVANMFFKTESTTP